MTIQEVKDYLKRAYYIDKRIGVLQDEISMLESRLYKCTSTYSHVGGSNQPTFEVTLNKIITYRDRMSKEVGELIDIKNSIEHTINMLDDSKSRLIMQQRYMLFRRFEDIAKDLNIDVRQVYRLHKKSLENLSNVIECQY